MPQTIPFDGTNERDQFDTEIDGIRLTFVARWNERADNRDIDGNETEGAWFFDIYDEQGLAIIYGVRIAMGVPLARWLRHPLTRTGCLVASDTSGRLVDPGRFDLGTRVQVLYYPEDEVVAAIAEANR